MALNRAAHQTGVNGEEIATRFLINSGFEIIDRNWRIKKGEIDIVALSPKQEVVFCEVKTRSSLYYGDPFESVTPEKALRLQHLALAWLAMHQRLGGDYRIDVISIVISRAGGFTLEHHVGVV